MQGCIHKTESSNLLLMAAIQNWEGPEQIPTIEGTLNLPHVLNLPYSTTGELWGALLYLSPSLMYPSYNCYYQTSGFCILLDTTNILKNCQLS